MNQAQYDVEGIATSKENQTQTEKREGIPWVRRSTPLLVDHSGQYLDKATGVGTARHLEVLILSVVFVTFMVLFIEKR